MGIRCLMTYMEDNKTFHESYELHGSKLVIDGHNVAMQIYIASRCNSSFGGDYNVYARAVGKFFDDLTECRIEPLIILRGKSDLPKTIYKKMAEKLKLAKKYNPTTEDRKFIPLGMMSTFETVARQKKLKMFRCTDATYATMAGVAKVLNCPVLSNNSDLYLYGAPYIPFKTLMPYWIKTGQGYARRCKLFRPEYLQRCFPGLGESNLPLATILLDPDFMQSVTLKNFFNFLGLDPNSWRYDKSKERIDTVLEWLSQYSLEDAVASLLRKVRKKRRPCLLGAIERTVNTYRSLSSEPFVTLGLEEEYNTEMSRRESNEGIFLFRGTINAPEEERLRRDNGYESSDDSSPDAESDEEVFDAIAKKSEKNLKNTSEEESPPTWFLQRYSSAHFSRMFMKLLCERVFKVGVQIEDTKYPSASEMSLGILRVIEGLLVAERNVPEMIYQTRNGTVVNERRFSKPIRGTRTTKFPRLEDLRDTDLATKKRIIDDTLDITGNEEVLIELPTRWRLYVALILYWKTRSDQPPRDSCHLHALLFTMLFNVIDDKIGDHRAFSSLKKGHKDSTAQVPLKHGNSSRLKSSLSTPGASIIEALDAVDDNDCVLAAPLFVSIGTMDRRLVECPHRYNVTIVHGFSQFQACLKTAIHLNTLLGYPYDEPILAELYNGTMLYNLYEKFANSTDVETYIYGLLEKSPGLLNVMKLLIELVKRGLEKIVVDDLYAGEKAEVTGNAK